MPDPSRSQLAGSGMAGTLGPNVRYVGPSSPPLLLGTKALMNAPVVPLYCSTLLVPKLLTKRFPLGPKVRSPGASSPPLPLGTKALMKAPVVPLYCSTLLVPKLLTKRFPLGPKVSSRGPSSPPLPLGTKALMKAPVVPLYCNTLLLFRLLTKRSVAPARGNNPAMVTASPSAASRNTLLRPKVQALRLRSSAD